MLDVNFYDFHSIRDLDMPDLKVTSIGCSSPFASPGAKGLGKGGGGGIVTGRFNPPERVWRLLHDPGPRPVRISEVDREVAD